LIPLTIVLIPSFLAIFYGLVSYFFSLFKPKNNLSSIFLFSLIFGVLEFIRGSIFTGFPWNLIAFSFSNQLEILSITSVIGTYGFNLLCICFYSSPAIIFLQDKKIDVGIFIFFLFLFSFFYSFGYFYEKKFHKIPKEDYEYKLRVIGSNIQLDRFYSNIDSISVIKDLIKISKPDPQEKIIFLWPEGILPDISQDELIDYNWIFKDSFNENHLLIIGTNSEIERNGSKDFYNSVELFSFLFLLKMIDNC